VQLNLGQGAKFRYDDALTEVVESTLELSELPLIIGLCTVKG